VTWVTAKWANRGLIAHKIGAKYYENVIPIELSYNGVGFGEADANPTYVGFQGGYALFFG
jgi:hypothetical protein